MQLRFATNLTGEEYVSQKAWRNATLAGCPLHPKGGCGFARHGTYERRSPPGTLIARWYCPQGRRTFSLLPDCLAARLAGTLAEVEEVVLAVEQAESLEAACSSLRLDIELAGVLRWVRRRVQAVYASLILLKGLLPEWFQGCEPTLGAFAQCLGLREVLPALRPIAAPYLSSLPAQVVDVLLEIKEGNPALSVQLVIREARTRDEVPQDLPLPASTVHRLLARHGLMDKPHGDQSDADRRRFAFAQAAELWMTSRMD